MFILTTYQRITQNGLSNKKYESEKVSSTKWNYFKLESPLLIFLIYATTLNLTRLYSKLSLIVFVIFLLKNLVVLFDKPKLYEKGVLMDKRYKKILLALYIVLILIGFISIKTDNS